MRSTDVALDEGLIDICNGLTLLEQPSSELIAASQVTSDAVPSISLLPQGGGKIIKVGTQWPAAKPVERRCSKKVCLDHELLLLYLWLLREREAWHGWIMSGSANVQG